MERLNIDEKNKKVENPFSFIIVGPMDSHTRINTGQSVLYVCVLSPLNIPQ